MAEIGNLITRTMERADIIPVLSMLKKVPAARGELTHRDLISWGLGEQRDASFIAEIDNQLVGFILARFTYHGIPVDDVCSLQVLFVDPDYHRSSIGTRLVDAVVERCYAEGINTMRVLFDQKNWELKNFFENLGFEPSGVSEHVRNIEVR